MNKIYRSEYDESSGRWVAIAHSDQGNTYGKPIKSNVSAKLASASVALGASVAILSASSAMAEDKAVQGERFTDTAEQDAAQPYDLVNALTISDGVVKGTLPDAKMFGTQLLGATPTGGSVLYDTAANNSISLQGTAGTKITNLTAGTLSATSMDAVNGSQLFSTNQNVSSLQTSVAQINSNGALGPLIAVNAGSWYGAQATGQASGAFGSGASASGDLSLALGATAKASGFAGTAIGFSANAKSSSS